MQRWLDLLEKQCFKMLTPARRRSWVIACVFLLIVFNVCMWFHYTQQTSWVRVIATCEMRLANLKSQSSGETPLQAAMGGLENSALPITVSLFYAIRYFLLLFFFLFQNVPTIHLLQPNIFWNVASTTVSGVGLCLMIVKFADVDADSNLAVLGRKCEILPTTTASLASFLLRPFYSQ